VNTKEVFGKEVLDADAHSVGKVSDMNFDLKQGIVKSIVVKAGLTKKHEIPVDKIDRIGDKVILNVPVSDLG
jgi:sporulation protein YlmC with PRC-barrel domain